MKTKRMYVVTNIPQSTCMAIFNDLIYSQKSFVIFTPGSFRCSPNFNLFSMLMWNFTVANKIKFFCWNWLMYKLFTKKLYHRELVTSDCFFVVRNNSGVQIFHNDEKARQRHLPKMYTMVVSMNWNRFRNIFRIRFRIFYNRSELSQCLQCVWPNTSVRAILTITSIEDK